MKKTVIITGASRGIGRACALWLGKRGWCVVINYHSRADAAEETTREIQKAGGEAYPFQADVADYDAVCKMTEFAHSLHGSIDALVNNAAVSEVGLFDMIDRERERRLFDVNLHGAMDCARAVLPHMLHQHSGSIINIASMWGQTGASCEVAYSAAKAGLIGFTKALAKELAPSGIRVNCVAPGFIDTEMNAHLSDEDKAAFAEEIPMGRIGRPEEVAECVAFLCENASYVTGQILSPNGGYIT
ncbi:MAG: SDR family oxidoreductase [Clostridia bacterium]|nr:SDR family oxidoreductase [Clostridia bacterium]